MKNLPRVVTKFFVQCAMKFVHEHENFRRKPLKGNGRGRIEEGKERAPPGYFVQGAPEFLVTPLTTAGLLLIFISPAIIIFYIHYTL